MRADQLLVERGMAPTRSAAQRLIATGAVRWRAAAGWRVPSKAGEDLPSEADLQITDDAELRFVSRGGLKLDGALARLGLDVAGLTCLDVGQSTGGFTDVLLSLGAASVVGIDVGHGQLHPRLRADPRVVALEGINARALAETLLPRRRFGLVVADLSFISLTLVLPALAARLESGGDLLALVKPQFELQPADIGRRGIVSDPASHARVEMRIRAACATCGLGIVDYFESAIEGGDGNREFFVHARGAGDPT
jgi:23S rRNA (cytidine1920-2'-O)/16S rRNA (cytidine1409-2'-O)-methyltransferase